MRVNITNRTNRRRSIAARQDLKDFAVKVAEKLGISDYIEEISLYYLKTHRMYFREGPLGGFRRLWDGKRIRIDIAKHWDTDQHARKTAIVHEMTHVKQMIDRRLVIHHGGKSLKWRGRRYDGWKNYKFALDKTDSYRIKHLPWESEVVENIRKYAKRR